MRAARKNIQIVFQDPYGSLNPRMKIADILRLSASSEAEIGREESEEESAETGKGHGKRAGKTKCRDGQYRDHK